MTIRYTCEKCGSVLKIKDDRAGRDGHCPKCKATFVVPTAEAAAAPAVAANAERSPTAAEKMEGAGVEKIKPAGTTVKTAPAAVSAVEDADFDPVAFLMSDGGGKSEKAAAKPAAARRGGEEADMRGGRAKGPADYSASDEPDERVGGPRKSPAAEADEESAALRLQRAPKRAPPSAAQTADEMLRSTAAANAKELMTKVTEESRLRAAQMPEEPEKPGVDYKQAARDLFLQFAPATIGVVALVVLMYWFGSYMAGGGPDLPDLGYVTGKVTKGGKPMVGAQVIFSPVDVKAGAATAYTDEEGNYVLKYTEGVEGAVLGKNRIEVSLVEGGREQVPPMSPYGPGSNIVKTVEPGSQTIDIEIP